MKSRPRFHRLFGLTLGSDVPFDNRFGEGGGPPADLDFSYGPPGAPLPDEASCLYSGINLHLFRAPAREVLRVTNVADFHLWPERIVAHPAAAEAGPLIEIHLLGTVLSYWLERSGLVTLHASAVEMEGRAAVFSSTHGGGKTGLAAALLQTGHPLLGDDLLPIEEREGTFVGRPGYPQMRMWPDEAAHFLGSHEHLPVVHPGLSKRRVPVGAGGLGTFHGSPLPLACIYILERGTEEEAPDIRDLSPRDALIELLRHSFTPLLVEAAGLQPARFDLLSRLVLQVPVKRLRYPSGFDRLPRVAEAVRRDLERC
ncbi:MAG TPA: hypothetical protein VKM72_00495 [Thermoanaerobaculia bacterium]|nr:hypothetical protein [Thermoanaerobaculia bacterium]